MLLKSVVLVVLALGAAQGAIRPIHHALNQALEKVPISDPGVMADMSEWVDEIMANLRAVMKEQGMDSIHVPDQHFEFSETFLGVVWHGEADIFEIYLRGLETIHRTGIADLQTDPNGDIIITVDVGVNDASIAAGMTAKFMNLGPTADITGKLKDVQVKLTIRAGFADGGLKAQVDDLNIKHLGTLSIDVKGLGFILNFLVELVVDVLGNLIKGIVGDLLAGPIKNLINDLLKNPPPIGARALRVMAVAPLSYRHVIPRAFPKHL